MGKEQDLVQAIRTNDVESFKKIIAKFKLKTKKAHKKSSLHIVDHDGFIPLHHAALSGNGEIVMGLLEFTTDVNAKDKKGMTPLHLAAWAGKVEPALLLLDAGAQTNLCARSGATPLHLASEHGNYGVVERLVDHDCDPTVVNNQGETALDLACRFGHLEVVRILLNNSRGKCEKLLNPKEFQEKASPLHMASKAGHFDIVKLLVEAGTDINQRGPTGTCLHEAALYGKTDVVKYLIESGIDVNVKNREGHTALDMVSQFTKSGALSEIKHLLREASVEVVYAKAIKDYCNIKDDSFLTLRMGDIVLVLDRRKDGMWKGCVRDDQKERIGFFPSAVVKVLRSPSRNSVKRSSSSSSEASKVSTVGTVSNTFEIVTVTPPNQPVASKSRVPRMSSFRKKAPNKSSSESDDRRAPNATSKNGEARRDTDASSRSQSESNVDEKKKALNYLDVMVVEKHNNDRTKSEAPSIPTTKTEYVDVWVTNSNDEDNKDIQRTNETQKSVRVNGNYARLGKQVLGTQGTEDNAKLRQELQRQQEERMKRQQKRLEEENVQKQEAEKQLLEQTQRDEHGQELLHKQQKMLQQVKLQQRLQQQPYSQPPDTQFQEQKRSSSESQLSPNQPCPPIRSRHYTMSSLVASSQDLPPLPLNKRHSLSGGRPSIPSVTDPILPPRVDKKNRSSLRPDRRGTSPPPPPPPPPSGSTTPSSASSDVSPNFTPVRSPSPTLPPPPKPNEAVSFSNQPVRSPSPSFPPPPPENTSPGLLAPFVIVNQDERSPSPPLPPPPMLLISPSTSSLGDFPPPPSTLMENHPESSDGDTLPPPATAQSVDGYEDMTRLRRTWTKPEVPNDKKGYVIVTPVKRPSSPASSPAKAPTSSAPKPLSVSSMFYENFIPLKTRNFEVRKLQSVPDEAPNNEGETSPTKFGVPEKPDRHCYVNCAVSGHNHGTKKPASGDSHETSQETKDNSSETLIEKSTPGALPTLRVPPVIQVSTDPPVLTNIRMPEYDELYDWLAQSKLLTYMDNFAAAGFDLSAMAGLTADDLSEIEITKTGHRKRLLSEASKLLTPDFSYENNVPSWLKSLGLSRYEDHFMEGGFDDMEFLYDLTREDLVAIGITKVGHQRKILIAAKKLQQRENENLATSSNTHPGTGADNDSSHGGGNDVMPMGVTRVSVDERVGAYAVPRVSCFGTNKTDVDESSTDARTQLEEPIQPVLDTHSQGSQRSDENFNSEREIFESNKEIVEDCNTLEMNGISVSEDNVDGVKELAATFQHAIQEETAKAKGRKPPPVKPKSYKKVPPPVVAPKPRANGVKSHKIDHSPTDVSSRVDFTEVIREAESLSESGSEQSPPSTLGRDRKSGNGVSVDSSLVTTTSGSQGSLNSESDGELQREIRESLHRKRSTGTSIEDLTKMTYLTLSQEDLLEQQEREEELEKYQEEQSKTDSLFNDIQGMLDNLNSELDDMFK